MPSDEFSVTFLQRRAANPDSCLSRYAASLRDSRFDRMAGLNI